MKPMPAMSLIVDGGMKRLIADPAKTAMPVEQTNAIAAARKTNEGLNVLLVV
jgi:hypothetical protein